MSLKQLRSLYEQKKLEQANALYEQLRIKYSASVSLRDSVEEIKKKYHKSVLGDKTDFKYTEKKSRTINLISIENTILCRGGSFYVDPLYSNINISRSKSSWGIVMFPVFLPGDAELKIKGEIDIEKDTQLRILDMNEKQLDESNFGNVLNFFYSQKKSSLVFVELRVRSNSVNIKNLCLSITYHASPQYTVIIPFYNDSKYIENALNSVINQTFPPQEILLINDASNKDEVQKLECSLKNYQEYKNIRLVHHKENKGLAASRNTGIRESKTDLITFLDSDDALTRKSIEFRYNDLINDISLFACGSAGKIKPVSEDFENKDLESIDYSADSTFKNKLIALETLVNSECPFNCHAPLLWKYFVECCNCHNESMRKGAEDYDLWSRMLLSGFYFIETPKVVGVYRQKKKSMVKSDNTGHLNECIRISRDIINGASNLSKPFVMPWKYSKLEGKAALQIEASVKNRIIANLCYNELSSNNPFKNYYGDKCFHPSIANLARVSKVVQTAIMRENSWRSNLNNQELDKLHKVYSLYQSLTQDAVTDEKKYYNTVNSYNPIDNKEDSFIFDHEEMSSFRDIHKGESCIIIGNGPSLNKHDFSEEIYSRFKTFAVNGFFYKSKESNFFPTYYVVEDTSVMKENIEQIVLYQPKSHKFFPSIYKNLHPKDSRVSFFKMNRDYYDESSPHYEQARFSKDAAEKLYCGRSVTIINLQLAYHMGFKNVYLIGMDFSYQIPKDAEVKGAIIKSNSDDPNHFHPDYFGKGKTWKDPKLDSVLRAYEACKVAYESDNRKIFNATVGGKLELFERSPLPS